jgi:hypothetical protein
MQEQERLSDEERQVHELLQKLRPVHSRFSAFEVLLETERRRSSRQLWEWRGIAACLALGLSAALLLRPNTSATRPDAQYTRADQRPASSMQEPTPPPILNVDTTSLTGSGYVASRNRVLLLGLSSLPAPAPSAALQAPSTPHAGSLGASSFLKFVGPLVNGGQL